MRLVFLILTLILNAESSFAQFDDDILSSLKRKFKLSQHDQPNEIIKFNKDTILVAGYLADVVSDVPRYEQKLNIVYKTTDGGANWKQVQFNGNAWIYDSYHDRNGNVWMGGSDNYVHYSPDFGETWQRKPEPFVPINRVHSIFMVNSKFGIAGGLQNGLALTFDNWGSVKQIPTPLDQGKYRISSNSSRNKIERVSIIDSIILINQNEHVYFSKLKNIQWTEFNIPVIDFSIDELSKQISLQSRNGKYFVLSSNLDLVKTFHEDFPWEEIKDETISLSTDNFFKTDIKSFTLKATQWIFDRLGHMGAIYKPVTQEANFIEKAGIFQLKLKKYTGKELVFTSTKLATVFSSEQVNFPLSMGSQKLLFTDLDIKNYKDVLEKEKLKRKEEKEWGGRPCFSNSFGQQIISRLQYNL